MSQITWSPQSPEVEGKLPNAPFPMPSTIWQVLYSRGLRTKQAVEDHISPKLKHLSDPFCLHDMQKAVERLVEALGKGEKICVYGDFDLDGTSGLALLKKGLELLGFKNLTHYQPSRLTEGYGVHGAAIQKLSEQGVSLLVTVDVGITAHQAVDKANELGMNVIITDHHLPKETLPNAHAVVNPNKGHCDSQLGHLCGAGVGFYLILALRSELSKRGLLENDFDPKRLLDCFVIATLTDLVPLVRENRALVKHGLVELARTQRPGLRALLKELELWGRPLTSQDVAIRFAPKLNALSRLETGIMPLDLYLVESEDEAQQMVQRVMRSNQMRLTLQKEAEAEAMELAKSKNQKGYIWVWSRNFHRGVVGLVATKLSQEFNVPAFVGSVAVSGAITGSSRAPSGQGINLLLAFDSGQPHLTKFGGHAPAAGFELPEENAEAFDQALNRYFADSDRPSELVLFYDAIGCVEELDESFMKWYDGLGPFGTKFEPPVFMLRQMEVVEVRKLKGSHIKVKFRERTSTQKVEGIWFSPPQNHPVLKSPLDVGQVVDALVEPQWNYFNGRKTIQALIKDIRWSS